MKRQLSPKQRLLRLAILTPLVVLLALCFAAAPVHAQAPTPTPSIIRLMATMNSIR